MSDITILNEKGRCKSILFIDDVFQTMVKSFSIKWDCVNDLPILQVDGHKPDEKGRPYTICGGYAADITKYYPVHSLKILTK
jgi:hypothetical protein